MPIVGITAADRVDVTASATVNDASAMNTLVSAPSLSRLRLSPCKHARVTVVPSLAVE